MTAPLTLTNPQARRLFLHRHALSGAPVGNPGRAALREIIDRLGFVQIDSINTVARAHDMILFSRQQSYRPRDLKLLAERDRALFEHWTHDAAIIPMRFYPYWRPRFARDADRLRARWKTWRGEGFEEKSQTVLDHIRAGGPACSREVGANEARSSGGWWDWHPSKTALEFLWHSGELAVCHREGFQKYYDLAERVIPDRHFADLPDEQAFIDWKCTQALDRLGFATHGEIAAFWASVSPEEAKAWCKARLGRDLIEVEIEGAPGQPTRKAYARPDVAEAARDAPEPTGRVRILSPFDPALRDRKRAERLFGFHYRIEVFVPEAKRRYGYYVFPVMEGDRLIGRIDMKCRRDEGVLQVRAFWPEAMVRMGQGRLDRLQADLDRYRVFTEMETVGFDQDWLREPLMS